MEIVRVNSLEDLKKYVNKINEINGYDTPLSYFRDNETCIRVVKEKGAIVGGYALVFKKSRLLDQVPKLIVIKTPTSYLIKYPMARFISFKEVAELTGYFMESVDGFLKLSSYLLYDVLTSRAKYFVYSFAFNNKKLAKYYMYANPIFVYCGKLESYEDRPEAQVEMLTKYGMFKLFCAQLFNKSLRKLGCL